MIWKCWIFQSYLSWFDGYIVTHPRNQVFYYIWSTEPGRFSSDIQVIGHPGVKEEGPLWLLSENMDQCHVPYQSIIFDSQIVGFGEFNLPMIFQTCPEYPHSEKCCWSKPYLLVDKNGMVAKDGVLACLRWFHSASQIILTIRTQRFPARLILTVRDQVIIHLWYPKCCSKIEQMGSDWF